MTIPTLPGSSVLRGQTYPMKRAPMWATDREESIAGLSVRYPLRNIPRWQYEWPYSFLRMSSDYPEWQTLASFFNGVFGSQGLFQFRDPSDYQASAQGFGVSDGTTGPYQLVRTGPGLLGTFAEPVYAPSTITSLLVGSSALSSTRYTLSTGGQITFAVAPAAGQALVWSGEFNWLARFDQDVIDLSQIVVNLQELQKLSFTTELLGT